VGDSVAPSDEQINYSDRCQPDQHRRI